MRDSRIESKNPIGSHSFDFTFVIITPNCTTDGIVNKNISGSLRNGKIWYVPAPNGNFTTSIPLTYLHHKRKRKTDKSGGAQSLKASQDKCPRLSDRQ